MTEVHNDVTTGQSRGVSRRGMLAEGLGAAGLAVAGTAAAANATPQGRGSRADLVVDATRTTPLPHFWEGCIGGDHAKQA